MMMMMMMMIELKHSKTIQENTVEIEPQPVALYLKNISQYSSCVQIKLSSELVLFLL